MNISEQVKELRELANSKEFEMHEPVTYGFYGKIKSKLLKAADTIETLSAKLQAENMEDCGGWISCKERLPKVGQIVIVCQSFREIHGNPGTSTSIG